MSEVLALTVLSGLVAWRLASLLHTEDAFEWLRTRIGIENDEQGYPAIYPETFWGKTFRCFLCLSTIVALPVSVACVCAAGGPWTWLAPVWLASSTVAMWTEKQIMRSASR